MKRWMIAAVVVCLSSFVSAQAPVPKRLREAKRVFLANDGIELRALNEFAEQLREWNRFALVDDETEADVVMTLGQTGTGKKSRAAYPNINYATESESRAWTLTITAPNANSPLYGDRDGGIKGLAKRLRETLADAPATASTTSVAQDAVEPAATAIAPAAEPCRIFVTEEQVSPSWYSTIKDLKYGKKWYGESDHAFRALAQQAWKTDADAVVAVDLSFRPSMWSWASPHAKGIAVKWNDDGRRNFAKLKGRCYERETAKP